jgi:hypothetical protein
MFDEETSPLPFQAAGFLLFPSLRANGLAQSAARSAKQSRRHRQIGLLGRFAPRNDGLTALQSRITKPYG